MLRHKVPVLLGKGQISNWTTSGGAHRLIISHQHRFIFFKTRKTAGTSIERALVPLCGPEDIIAATHDGISGRNDRLPVPLGAFAWWWRYRRIQRSPFATYYPHERAELIKTLVGRRVFNSYFKFTIERNPWDREVSLYFWRTRKRPDTSFNDFVRTNRRKYWVDNFDIYTIDGKLAADHVMRYENLSDELTALARIIGCDPSAITLPHAKQRRVDKVDYRTYYDDELRNIIANRHRREIELFEYSFE
jgi:Sulfotransferase family